MTDRHAGYIVTLDRDIRDDDAQPILDALRMIQGVIDVHPVVADTPLMMAQARADVEWRKRIVAMLIPEGTENP